MLLSACIIAKDEEARLPACLASLNRVVDEIVVYDTGSSDGTVRIAAEAGAVVVTGSWPGGFAQARNAALEHCRGEWVLSVDADEELVCSHPAGLRAELQSVPALVQALQVPIDNVTGVGLGSGYSHVADRLFRRRSCRWRGRLHEQLVLDVDGSFPPVRPASHARLRHLGYLHDVEAAKNKTQRNLELARAEVEDPSFGDRGVALVWLGRALWAADRPDEAMAALLEGARSTTNPVSRRQGLETAARIALRLDRLDDAGPIISELRAASDRLVVADLLDGGAALAAGRYREALRFLDATGMAEGPVIDDDGHEYGPHHQLEWRAAALVGLGRPAEAAELILDGYQTGGRLDADLDLLVEAMDQASRPLGEFATLVPPPLLPTVVAAALRLQPERSHRLLEALWLESVGRGGDATTVLAGGSLLGRLLEPEAAATWSRRLRDRGLGDLCPLRAVVSDTGVPPDQRLEAARILRERFAEDPAEIEELTSPPVEPQVRWKQRSVEPPDVSVVLLATGGAELVLGALQSLAATLPEDVSFEVIAVDPGSRDATSSLLASLDGDLAVVRTELDVGRARARNLGLRTARGRIAVIMESTARPRPGWIQELLAAFDADRSLGVAGPLLLGDDGAVLSAGAAVRFESPAPPPAAGLGHRPWGEEPPGVLFERRHRGSTVAAAEADGVVQAEALDPAVMAVRRAVVAGMDGFDEGYWGGGETADLCFKLRAAGLAVICQPASQVQLVSAADAWAEPWAEADPGRTPLERGSGPRWQYRENRRRFIERWAPARVGS